MGTIKGYEGIVDFDGFIDSDNCAYRTTSWSVDVEGDVLETTDFCSTAWKAFIAGLKGWTGSLELNIDDSALLQPSDVNETATLRLYLDSSNGLTGDAIMNTMGYNVSVDGLETQTINFTGTSDLSTF